MKSIVTKSLLSIFLFSFIIIGCNDYNDEGSLQYQEKEFLYTDFDRVEVRNDFIVKVKHGNFFSISTRGDRRNIDDLLIRKSGNTLTISYATSENRKHETYIDITMPALAAANFSGACNAVISGFKDQEAVSLLISGASIAQADMSMKTLNLTLSGAAICDLIGTSAELQADISGASSLKAFNMSVQKATLSVSGASATKISVSDQLKAKISGASTVVYKGNPVVESDVSGASSLTKS